MSIRQLIKFILITLLFANCSDSDSVVAPVPKPVAYNDLYTTTQNLQVDISDILENDENAEDVSLELNTSSTKGQVLNLDGVITFTPENNFIGKDSFIYTICETTQNNCSTATVFINVEQGDVPVAVNDAYTSITNEILILSDLTVNDLFTGTVTITSVDKILNTEGEVEVNNNVVTYTPKTDFVGEDTFTYTICDDANNLCATATVTVNIVTGVTFNIPSNLQDYYKDVVFVQDIDIMFDEIESVTTTKHTTILTYGQRHDFLYDADEDMSNTANVILMYSAESRDEREWISGNNSHSPQTFNTEHVYPRSLLAEGDMGDAFADLHHLRACDEDVNTARLNYPFTEGSGAYGVINSNMWYPGDEWKGDVARMILYLNIRYGETFNKVGSLELFLKWNEEDPVSAFEEQRNEVISGAQGNRNPFIDNPYLATLIWGGNAAENKW